MIKNGSQVRRKSDGPNGPVGTVTDDGAKVAGLMMKNPKWADRVFVVWRGDDLGWYKIDELVEVN